MPLPLPALVAALLFSLLLSQKMSASEASLPPHPRLLATESDFQRIRKLVAKDESANEIFKVVRAAAEADYDKPPVTHIIEGRRMLNTSRTALRRILEFSFMYRMTGDQKWSARAEREMLALAEFPDWNPSHFLDVAEAAAAIAIGYDWIHDTLPPESRRTIREALIRHALEPGEQNPHWTRQKIPNNWLQVCEGGLALAALAVGEDSDGLTERTLSRARKSVPRIFNSYEPDGAYIEGCMYWNYGTAYHLLLVEALRSAGKSTDGLADHPAFLQSADVFNILTSPRGDFYNFSDCSPKRRFSPELYWFARETRNPGLVSDEIRKLNPGSKPGVSHSRFLPLALLWMVGNAEESRSVPPPEAWATQGENPLAVFRSGEGRNALGIAIRGGSPGRSHGHMDAGSFIFDLGGVRWAVDPGMPNYHQVEQHGIRLFGKDRWQVFLVGPNSHSIPLINDRLPDADASAPLVSFDAEAKKAAFDLTPLYRDQATVLHRELRVESPESISIRDSFEGVAPGSVYRFQWMTFAKVTLSPNGAILEEKDLSLHIEVEADAPFQILDEDASIPPNVWDAPIPGLRRISILLIPEKSTHELIVRAFLISDKNKAR